MRLEISRSLADRIRAAAAADRGREVCGLLFGGDGRINSALPCNNVAATPTDSFELDPGPLLAAHKAMRVGGPTLIGHYHSHPRGYAEPSARDAEAAAADGLVWLIVAGDAIGAWRATGAGRHGMFAPLDLIEIG